MSNMQRNIEKARALYLTKGVLKRDLLRDEIVYSWVRSRLVNLDSTKLPTACVPEKSNLRMDKLWSHFSLHELGVNFDESQILSILHVSHDGNIKNEWSKSPVNRYYFNFLEDCIGTSGIGLTIKNGRKSKVAGYEHYHQYLVNTITMGIPSSDNTVIGIVFELKNDHDNYEKLYSRLPDFIDMEVVEKQTDIDENTSLSGEDKLIEWPTCLFGDSQLIKHARDRTMQFKDSQLLFISGPKGIGKESTANFIHKLSKGEKSIFHAVYCDKLPIQRFCSEWLEDSDQLRRKIELYDIGTVYFENFDVLPLKYQRKFLRILDSKLVNSNDGSDWYKSDVTFILSLTNDAGEVMVGRRLTKGLQSRLKLAEISLPGLTDRREDICPIFGHLIIANGHLDYDKFASLNSRLNERIEQLDFESNLRDLDHIAFELGEKLSGNETVTDKELDEILQPYSNVSLNEVKLKALSEIECEAIIKTLNALNFNMVQTAAILGISRSTLYRKIEHYHITIDAVR